MSENRIAIINVLGAIFPTLRLADRKLIVDLLESYGYDDFCEKFEDVSNEILMCQQTIEQLRLVHIRSDISIEDIDTFTIRAILRHIDHICHMSPGDSIKAKIPFTIYDMLRAKEVLLKEIKVRNELEGIEDIH